jgi:hypothetical protein
VSSQPPAFPPALLEAFGAALAQVVAGAVARAVEERLRAEMAPTYATAKHNPLGSARSFLDAARRGDFRSHKVGREVRALWTDVDSYIQTRPGARRRAERATLEQELATSAGPRRGRVNHG